MFKNSRFVLLSNRSTLEAKDKAEREHNLELNTKYERKGLALPPGERKWRADNVDRLKTVLAGNQTLQTCYVLLEMLKGGLRLKDEYEFTKELQRWLAVAKKANIEPLD